MRIIFLPSPSPSPNVSIKFENLAGRSVRPCRGPQSSDIGLRSPSERIFSYTNDGGTALNGNKTTVWRNKPTVEFRGHLSNGKFRFRLDISISDTSIHVAKRIISRGKLSVRIFLEKRAYPPQNLNCITLSYIYLRVLNQFYPTSMVMILRFYLIAFIWIYNLQAYI